jgi:hypothetical protein
MDITLIEHLLVNLSEAPPNQIDEYFSKEISNYVLEKDYSDIGSFLNTLTDRMVFYGGCSNFVISILGLILKDYPETANQANQRGKKVGLTNAFDTTVDEDMETTRVDIPRSSRPPPQQSV